MLFSIESSCLTQCIVWLSCCDPYSLWKLQSLIIPFDMPIWLCADSFLSFFQLLGHDLWKPSLLCCLTVPSCLPQFETCRIIQMACVLCVVHEVDLACSMSNELWHLMCLMTSISGLTCCNPWCFSGNITLRLRESSLYLVTVFFWPSSWQLQLLWRIVLLKPFKIASVLFENWILYFEMCKNLLDAGLS